MKKSVFFCTITLIAASIAPIHASLTMIENEKQFNEIVNADTPSVIVFSAEWCGGCKALKEPFQKVIDNSAFKHVTFAKVDVDKNDAISKKYNIRYLPTILFMQAGQKKHEIIGRESETTIGKAINTAFGAGAAAEKIEQVEQKTAPTLEGASTQPTQEISTGTFQLVWNLIASMFNYTKDLIVNAFGAVISFFKNLF